MLPPLCFSPFRRPLNLGRASYLAPLLPVVSYLSFCFTLQLMFFAMLYLSMTGMAQASLSLRAIYVPPSLLRNLAQQLIWCVVDGLLFCR